MLAAMDLPCFAHQTPRGLALQLKVVPGASRSQIMGPLGERLKIRISAPAEEGRANAAVLALLAEWLGTGELRIIAGHAHAEKTVLVEARHLDLRKLALSRRAP